MAKNQILTLKIQNAIHKLYIHNPYLLLFLSFPTKTPFQVNFFYKHKIIKDLAEAYDWDFKKSNLNHTYFYIYLWICRWYSKLNFLFSWKFLYSWKCKLKWEKYECESKRQKRLIIYIIRQKSKNIEKIVILFNILEFCVCFCLFVLYFWREPPPHITFKWLNMQFC